jgi:hypothetical protein
MFAPILAVLLVSGPPARSPNTETALRIANELAGNLKVSRYDLEVSVRNRRDVSISGRIDSIDDLKAVLDTVTPHADSLQLNISIGDKPPHRLFSGRPAALERHRILEWDDGAWQKSLRLKVSPASSG